MTDAIKWCHAHFAPLAVMEWIRSARIGTMDEFWAKCHRGDRMLWALAGCRLDRSAEMARLEFAARCADRALAQELKMGRKPDTRLWNTIHVVRGFMKGTIDITTLHAAASLAYDVPTAELPTAESSIVCAINAIHAMLEVAVDGPGAVDAPQYVDNAATAAVSALAGDDEKLRKAERQWQADTLRELLQPDGGVTK